MTEGGGWGEEFRHNRATINNSRPRRPERMSSPENNELILLAF